MNLEKSQVKYLFVLALLALTLPMAAWLASRPQLIQKQAACAVNLKLAPAAGSYARSAPFVVNLQVEAGTAAVAGVDASLTFDASKLKINSIVLGSGLNTEIINTINNTNGTARISAVKMSAGGVTGTFNFATIQFEGLAVTSAPVAVTLGNASVGAGGEGAACSIGTKTNGSYTITATAAPTNTPVPTNTPPAGGATNTPPAQPTPTGTISPTPTPTGGAGEVKVRFKIKFAGVDQKRADQRVALHVVGFESTGQAGGVSRYDGMVNVVSDDNGVYQSNWVNLTTPILPFYRFNIKGLKHLSTRYCSNVQNRPCSSSATYYIGLNPGENELNFSTFPLPAGDLPQQDGVVNALDATALTNCIASDTPDSQACVDKADLNFDGIVTTMDMNLMNNTIYTRWEDDWNE